MQHGVAHEEDGLGTLENPTQTEPGWDTLASED
jgi:hypothetical protein